MYMVAGIFFEELEHSRQDRKVKHSLPEILTVVMCGVSAGEMSIYGIREFAKLKESWLKEVIGLQLPNGLPSYNMVRRTPGILNPVQFQSLFIKRTYTLDTNIGWFADKKEWKNLGAFGMCKSIIKRKGKKTIKKRYFIRAEGLIPAVSRLRSAS